MKSHIAFFVPIVAALSFCACETIALEEIPSETVTLKAVIGQEISKTYIGNDNYIYWQDGDMIWINGNEYPISVKGSTATIEGVAVASSYSAVYPASAAVGYDPASPQSVTVNFPQVQEYQALNGNQIVGIPLAAYTTTEELSFSCVASVLRVNLTNDGGKDMFLESISITPEAVDQPHPEQFSGNAVISISASPAADAQALSDGSASTSLSFDGAAEKITSGSHKSYYIVVPPFQGSKLSVGIRTTDSEERFYAYSRKTGSAKQLGVNTIAEIPMTMAGLSEDYRSYFPSGTGGYKDPYIITNTTQLVRLRELVEAGDGMKAAAYQLGNDIDFEGETFYPIGTSDKPFKGLFYGGGHKIYNVVLGRRQYGGVSYYGLFGYAYNVRFTDLKVDGTIQISENTNYASMVCAYPLSCTFDKIISEGSISTTKTVALDAVGGIVGYLQNSSYSDVHFDDCVNRATINVTSSKVVTMGGGLVGGAESGFRLHRSRNEGDVTVTCTSTDGDSYCSVGGFLGWFGPETSNYVLNVDRGRNTGKITANANREAYAGGMFGGTYDNDNGLDPFPKVSNFVNNGTVYANSTSNDDVYSGGIAGYMYTDGPESGGLPSCPYFHNCLNAGTIKANGNDAHCGGICGGVRDTDTRFVLCVCTGAIQATGDPYKGAISGGSDSLFDGGTAYACFWTDSSLPCIYEDSDGDGYCQSMSSITSSFLNVARNDDTRFNVAFETSWENAQWAGTSAYDLNACNWIGDTSSGNLDIDLNLLPLE